MTDERESKFESLRERRRAKRLRKAELRLADLRHYVRQWGWAKSPSELDTHKREIERQEQKVEKLRASA